MEYATEYNIGYNQNTRKAKAKKTTQTGERIYRVGTKHQRCTRNKQRQAKICAGANAANGFLRCRFLPKLAAMQTVQPLEKIKKAEDDFYRSLCAVAQHYNGFEPTDTRLFGYPYNIAFSVWEAEAYLKKTVKSRNSLRLIQDDNENIFFLSEERYNTGTTLYYIAVIPLYRMLKNKKTHRAALLLLCVFTYLYQIAGIPYYRQEDTYLYWQYEMLADWVEQEEDEENNMVYKREIKAGEWIGNRMEQKICNRKNLSVFKNRINAFQPKNDFDKECLKLAIGAFALFNDFPETSIFAHAKYACEDSGKEDEVLTMEKYISFIADSKGWLYNTLEECINTDFGEYREIDEPAISKHFGDASAEHDNLDFENRLFPLLGDLCYLLNNE